MALRMNPTVAFGLPCRRAAGTAHRSGGLKKDVSDETPASIPASIPQCFASGRPIPMGADRYIRNMPEGSVRPPFIISWNRGYFQNVGETILYPNSFCDDLHVKRWTYTPLPASHA